MAVDVVRNDLLIALLVEFKVMEVLLSKISDEHINDRDVRE
jgi:hypothetical protein